MARVDVLYAFSVTADVFDDASRPDESVPRPTAQSQRPPGHAESVWDHYPTAILLLRVTRHFLLPHTAIFHGEYDNSHPFSPPHSLPQHAHPTRLRGGRPPPHLARVLAYRHSRPHRP